MKGRIKNTEIFLSNLLLISVYTFVKLHLVLAENLIVRVVSPELDIVDRHITLETCDLIQDSKVFLAFFRAKSLLDGLSENVVLGIMSLIFISSLTI